MEINRDARIGRNIARHRGERSQEWLAAEMRMMGHPKWSQSTVWSVEKGKRPLRLTEADDLAEVLAIGIEELKATEDEAELNTLVYMTKNRAFRASFAIRDYAATREQLRAHLARLEEEPREISDWYMSWARIEANRTLQSLVNTGLQSAREVSVAVPTLEDESITEQDD